MAKLKIKEGSLEVSLLNDTIKDPTHVKGAVIQIEFVERETPPPQIVHLEFPTGQKYKFKDGELRKEEA